MANIKCTFWQVSILENRFLGKCPFGQMYILASIRSGKCTFGIMSIWPSVFRKNVLSGRCFSGKCTGSSFDDSINFLFVWSYKSKVQIGSVKSGNYLTFARNTTFPLPSDIIFCSGRARRITFHTFG